MSGYVEFADWPESTPGHRRQSTIEIDLSVNIKAVQSAGHVDDNAGTLFPRKDAD